MSEVVRMSLTKRQQGALVTKRKIIEAATALISENGLDAINVEDITNKAGVSKGTFYTYFKKKEEIIDVVGIGPIAKINEQLETMQAPLYEKLTYFIKTYLKSVEDEGVPLTRDYMANELSSTKKDSRYAYDEESIKAMLLDGIKNKELNENCPVDDLTNMIMSLIYGISYVYVKKEGPSLESLVSDTVFMIKHLIKEA
jgi:AcrR family transcriptional regulator